MDGSARGRFVTLEGLEGVGKTTNLAAIVETLARRGIEPLVTREPGGTPLGERLRSLVLHEGLDMLARTELLLVAAARLEHVERVIEPALAAGRWVVSDRYLDASVAYQGGGRELGTDAVVELHERIGVTLEPRPDAAAGPAGADGAGARAGARRTRPDRVRVGRVLRARARAAYLERAAAAPGRVCTIDASAPLEAVGAAVAARVDALVEASLDPAHPAREAAARGGQA